jgi:hypothetical protein
MTQTKQRQKICDNCNTIFTGCRVFIGTIPVSNVCSQDCYEKNNKELDGCW